MINSLRKEIRYGLRNNTFLILFAVFFFFAFMTPVMLKIILPEVLKSQFPGFPLQELVDMTQLGCLQSYMGDVLEIGTLLVSLALSGLLAQEIRDNTLVLPLCAGQSYSGIIAAKMLVFGTAVLLIPFAALVTGYLYAGLLFSFDIGILPVITGGLLQGFYMVYLLSLLLLFGTLTRNPIATALLTLAVNYGLYFAGSLLDIHRYLPSGLLREAQQLQNTIPLQAAVITLAIIIACAFLASKTLQTLEWSKK
ncbi:MAG: hypothetical protein QM368_00525 [Bacillota bacterium]|nr:hypothetical protein [Bacillota bacterium]HHU29776.1 hypothetical protein [Bacillota bacterium]